MVREIKENLMTTLSKTQRITQGKEKNDLCEAKRLNSDREFAKSPWFCQETDFEDSFVQCDLTMSEIAIAQFLKYFDLRKLKS